jgi:hypothetical protein
MTRAAIVQRIVLETEALFPGADAFTDASADDLDRLWEALRDALESVRDEINETT